MRIDLIAGARSSFMKSESIIDARNNTKMQVGGITQETIVLGVSRVVLRNKTERPSTVKIGTSELIGTDPSKLLPALSRLMAGRWGKCAIPPR